MRDGYALFFAILVAGAVRGNSFGGFCLNYRSYATALALCLGAITGGCGQPHDPTATAATEMTGPSEAGTSAPAAGAASGPPATVPALLSGRLDCLREAGGAMVIAHRGGPTRDYPENAIETFERTLRAGARVLEADIVESRDGVLFLMHDDTLERTSTGEGAVAAADWADIRTLRLETYSTGTDFTPPSLAEALAWAVDSGAVLELDKKRGVEYAPVIAAIRAAGAENNVLVITYTDAQAAEVHAAAPDLVITATIRDMAHLDSLLQRGVNAGRLVAWTGTEAPDPELWRALRDRGIETAFGTMGSGDAKLDEIFWADRDGSEFNALIEDGLTFVVTSRSDMVSRQLVAEQALGAGCGL
jgi:glycerophosphoryl diester phosphodiesterase